MREFHIKIEKCEDCPFRQWLWEEGIGCRIDEGYYCYHPDKLGWVYQESLKTINGKWIGGNLYEGTFPTNCPLSKTEGEL